ncbi:hypothetical protein PATY110618_11375 [Paenibacillus typhae]|uniref:Uncharacterized protein n=1 Tax=Paenibacillus typhae TaxID=1174501 RepID=A0A1G9AZZ9_9BACL|nr:hypothetical protein SAMN05216192_13845 [Paenibacillus typhae]
MTLSCTIRYSSAEERFGLTGDVLLTEISLRLTKYTTELGGVLKEHMLLKR